MKTYSKRFLFVLLCLSGALPAAIITVGTDKQFSTPCAAIKAVTTMAGDIIEVDAGTYQQAAVFCPILKGLTIRGVNGQAIFDGNFVKPTAYQGTAIMAVDTRGSGPTTFENVEFINARGNGNTAGVKVHPDNDVTFRHGAMRGCENGVLIAGGVQKILFEAWEFEKNGKGDGLTHNLYDSGSAELTVRWSWSHDSVNGSLIKSRAAKTTIEYSRFDGTGNYEMDFSNGGEVLVLGSLIKQVPIGSAPNNNAVINYGTEGLKHPSNMLTIAYTTMINEEGSGRLISSVQDPRASCQLINSVVQSGPGFSTMQNCPTFNATGTVIAASGLVNADYRLVAGSAAISGAVAGLAPVDRQYTTLGTEPRTTVVDSGAYAAGAGLPPPVLAAITWNLVSGELPPAVTLSADGVLTGTPTIPGTYTFILQAVSPGAIPAQRSYTLVIAEVPKSVVIHTDSLPGGSVGKAYTVKLAASLNRP